MPEQTAREKVENRLKFYGHLGIFCVVNIVLVTLNFVRTPDKLWFGWVLGGWGVGLIFHAAGTFGNGKFMERMVQKELDKENKN